MHEAPHDIELIARHHLQQRRGLPRACANPAGPGRRRGALAAGLRRLADRLDG